MNESRYLLPVLLAAAFHAALLFGFSARSSVVITPPEKPVLRPIPPELIELLRQVPARTDDKPAASGKAGNSVPEQIEPPRPLVEKAILEMPVTDRSVIRTTAPAGLPAGLPDGVGSDPWGTVGGKFIAGSEQLDRLPHTKWRVSPEYPLALRQAGVEGLVVVEFVVDPQGRVAEARVLSASQREFEAAAIRAVMQWRFESGRRHGRPVAFRMTVPFEFKLDTE